MTAEAEFQHAYEQMAEHLNKTMLELTPEDKKRARTNEVARWIFCGTFADKMMASGQGEEAPMTTRRQTVDIILSRGLWKSMRPMIARRLLRRTYLALGRILLSVLARCGVTQGGYSG